MKVMSMVNSDSASGHVMELSKRLLIPIRDRLGPGGRRYAELLRVVLAFMRQGGALFARECNICGYEGRFYPAGFPSSLALRLDAGCPSCGSLERHRFLKIWADAHVREIEGRSVLHFAPERAVRRFMAPLAAEYATADVDKHKSVDMAIDIENIDLPDAVYGMIICSHVLEHVDDRKALRELHRILQPGGVLLVMVPVIEAWPETYEDDAVNTPADKFLHFGHSDHVRMYGADASARLAGAGFDVESFVAEGPDVSRFALTQGERLFVCRKK